MEQERSSRVVTRPRPPTTDGNERGAEPEGFAREDERRAGEEKRRLQVEARDLDIARS